MIRRVRFSEADIKKLASKTPPKETEDKVSDFSEYIVSKPWGEEYLMFQNDFVETWSLTLKQGHATSMHCHPNKKTALILLEGEAVFSTLQGSHRLQPFDSVVIEAGVFHSTKALSPEGIRLLEIETPPAKHDLIRLKDEYGREGQAYEGLNKMVLDSGECVRFPVVTREGTAERSLSSCKLCIKRIDIEELDEEHSSYLSSWDLLIVLEGVIYGPGNDEIYGVAEIVKADDLLKNKDETRIFNLTVMGIKGRQLEKQTKKTKNFLSNIISR